MATQRTNQKYGWIPDLPDWRDHQVPIPKLESPLPDKFSLEDGMPPVYDQSKTNSCTGNAVAAAIDYQRKVQGEEFMNPSRLFIYFCARALEDSADQDTGAMIRDCIKSIIDLGVCPESEWPFAPGAVTTKPADTCYTSALKFKALHYAQVLQTGWGLRYQIAVRKVPVVLGFTVYPSFESREVAVTGIVPMPTPQEEALGGHAVLCVGYDDATQRFRLRNSWGDGWGQKGYFELPYQYVLNPGLADDFWEIRATT